MTQKPIAIDRVVAAYITLRDKKAELAKKHKEEMEPITEQMNVVEAFLQKYLLDRNMESMRTEAGTAFLQRVASTTVRDWPATLAFIKAHGEWDFLEARVSKAAVKDYISNTGEVPPGVEFSEAVVTRVRR